MVFLVWLSSSKLVARRARQRWHASLAPFASAKTRVAAACDHCHRRRRRRRGLPAFLAQQRLEVEDGDEITAGDPIVEGPRDPKELLEIRGVRETQRYLVEEVQAVYRDQGVSIHDKHIELIVRGR